MKKAIITVRDTFDTIHKVHPVANNLHTVHIFESSYLTISDGYHTMDELYDHRIELYIATGRLMRDRNAEGGMSPLWRVWRSKLHADGSSFDGWFVLGIGDAPGYQITYHLPMKRWDDTEFAETLEKAPRFDGHTSADVLERLKAL